MQGLTTGIVCIYCGRTKYRGFDFKQTMRFDDCTITTWVRAQKCQCGYEWIDAKDWRYAEVAESDCLLALGTRNCDAFKFIRKMLGIGYADMHNYFGASKKETDAYRSYGLIQQEWWNIIATLVAEEKAKLSAPLPPCRGYTIG